MKKHNPQIIPEYPQQQQQQQPKQQQRRTLGQIKNLPPITLAAISTAVIMYPVDIVRALKMAQASKGHQNLSISQLMKNFYLKYGATGFLTQGVGAEMLRATFSRVIKFWMQPIMHEVLFKKNEQQGTPFTKGIAGALATIPEIIAISPFENAKLAKQLDTKGYFKGGTSQTLSYIIHRRGFLGLYTGYFGMQLRQMMWTGGFFLTLDLYKEGLEPQLGKGVYLNTVAGFAAGVTGTVLNCWCDVTRTGIQRRAIKETFGKDFKRPRVGMGYFSGGVSEFFGQAGQIYSQKGIAGLYAGFGVKSLYLGGSGALLATLIPFYKQLLQVDQN